MTSEFFYADKALKVIYYLTCWNGSKKIFIIQIVVNYLKNRLV